jgi:hypothetical protein
VKVNLLEYLDKLEATAKAASDGRWTEVNDWNSTRPDAPIDTIEITRLPCSPAEQTSWPGFVHVQIATIGDEHENADANRAHILATQPRATLAVIAKLREMAEIVNRATGIAIAARPEHAADEDLLEALAEWNTIEVPE